MTADLTELLDRLEAAAAAATPGRWKLWGMTVMADQDGTSDVDTAVRVAQTYYRDENGMPRTWDASLICEMQRALPVLIAELRRHQAAPDRPGDRDQQQAADWASAYDRWQAEPREFPGHGRRLAFRAGWEAAADVARREGEAAAHAALEDCESAGWAEAERLRAALAAARAEEAARWQAKIEAVASHWDDGTNHGRWVAQDLRSLLDGER